MAFVPTPKQALVMWRLMVMGEQPKQSEVRPDLPPMEREALVRAGLIRLEKRGRAKHLVLEDESAWAWATEHLDTPIANSQAAAPVLHQLLKQLKGYLARREQTLADLFTRPPEPAEEGTTNGNASITLEERIRTAYLAESGGNFNRRVRLCHLRARLESMPRLEVDAALITMQNQGRLVLYMLDNPAERHAEDEAAALTIGGEKQHILYMER
jgi:hypothetical protein